MQYNEWKKELNAIPNYLRSPAASDLPKASKGSNKTQNLAIKAAELSDKINTIEQTALEADGNIYPFILKAVTNPQMTYQQLSASGMPCGRSYFYEKRRRFYYLLDKKRR